MYVHDLGSVSRADLALAGGKGANLGQLVAGGFPVPPGFVNDTDAYVRATGSFEHDLLALVPAIASPPSAFETAAARIANLFCRPMPDELADEISRAYESLGSPAVAVRSSATAEDLADASFAGQQETFLNVQGADAMLHAVTACWASLWTARAMQYRSRAGIPAQDVRLAVVVQEMAPAIASGVMFTADPTSGRRDRSVISAAWGLGEAVVSGQVDTDNIVVGHDGRVLFRTTADKRVQTILTSDGVETAPTSEELREAVVLDDARAVELCALGVRIAEHFGSPQDIEWALTDGGFRIVQSRPITTLSDESADTPTDWPVPDPKALYFRASIIEQLPDPLTPLFGDVIEGAVVGGLTSLFERFRLGSLMDASQVRFPLINGYAYYQYSTGLLAKWTTMSPLLFPALLMRNEKGALGMWRRVRRQYRETVVGWRQRDLTALPAIELLSAAQDLLATGCGYYSSVQAVIPICATAELTFSNIYNRMIRRDGDPPSEVFLIGFDSTPIEAERSLAAMAPLVGDEAALDAAISQHLERFGHLLYNLDFANPTPADDPDLVRSTVRRLARDGAKVTERQQQSAREREAATAATRARLDPVRRRLFDRLLRIAQKAVPMREDALSDVGLAWPTIRALLGELGRRMVAAGALAEADDVYWLQLHEAEGAARALDGRRAVLLGDGHGIAERKALWRARRGVLPPGILPVTGWVHSMDRWMPTGSETQSGAVISGLGASAGVVTAPARVIAGPADFASMQPGEVLVASITTPAYTSLFALAAAVVTDVGGPLSHSSIVAREYRIPAVLGTAVATRRITTGMQITVDGDRGTVTLSNQD